MVRDFRDFITYLGCSLVILISVCLFRVNTNVKVASTPKPLAGNFGDFYGLNLAGVTGQLDYGDVEGVFEGKTVSVPGFAFSNDTYTVLGVATEERWIEVDLSEQKLRAWQGGSLFLESLVSTGLPWWPTPQGEFRIWMKLRATRMEGGEGKYYYNLPNVPYVMFFENSEVPGWRGYGLHGTYWHNDFGRVHSHGCVNLPTNIAKDLYFWTQPTLPDGKSMVRSSADNPGTRIVIHE